MVSASRKILYFLAGAVPTAAEQIEIDAIVGNVQLRNTLKYAVGDRLEPADGIAGTPPAAYTTAIADYPAGNVTPNQGGGTLKVFPVNPGGIAANGGTKQLYAILATLDEATGAITMTDVTTTTAWTSATPSKATVGASTGLVTGANGGAGTSVITASYDADAGGAGVAIAATTTATMV